MDQHIYMCCVHSLVLRVKAATSVFQLFYTCVWNLSFHEWRLLIKWVAQQNGAKHPAMQASHVLHKNMCAAYSTMLLVNMIVSFEFTSVCFLSWSSISCLSNCSEN